MSKLTKALIAKFNAKFKEELARQKKFFSKPDVLIALGVAVLLLLNKLITDKRTQKQLKDQLNKDANAKQILAFTAKEYDDENLNVLLLQCLSGDISSITIFPEKDVTNFLSRVEQNNDIDNKINYNKLQRLELQFTNINAMGIMYTMLLAYIIHICIDLFTRTEYPSIYRTKYTQKLTRNVYGLIKLQLNSLKSQGTNEINAIKSAIDPKTYKADKDALVKNLKNILDSLKQIDNILIAMGIATSIYIVNRKLLQEKSKESLILISSRI